MGLVINRIAVEHFRRFRGPVAIEGIRPGLNVLIEPNETGKSTLMEALRAAFFVPYSTRAQQAQSYLPHGDQVGPSVKVDFTLDGEEWKVEKRFLRSPTIELVGPRSTAQGAEAETKLQELLGSTRSSARGNDVGSHGALGLLWVAQSEGLKIASPSQSVRDTIAASLETEVGSILGGEAYRKVRTRVDQQYERYYTQTSGVERERLADARRRLETAKSEAATASRRLEELEAKFNDLEDSRARLKILQRDQADDTDKEALKALRNNQTKASEAALILAACKAEYQSAEQSLTALQKLVEAHSTAVEECKQAEELLRQTSEKRELTTQKIEDAKNKVDIAKSEFDAAKSDSAAAKTALENARSLLAQLQRANALDAARMRHSEVLALESAASEYRAQMKGAIPQDKINELEALDIRLAELEAALRVGATTLSFAGSVEGVLLDGEHVEAGTRPITGQTSVVIGATQLVITPPASAASAMNDIEIAREAKNELLAELGVASLAEARARNETARNAEAELRSIKARIDAKCFEVPSINLSAGSEALKLFVSEHANEEIEVPAVAPDIANLEAALKEADDCRLRKEADRDAANDSLRRLEEEDQPLAVQEAGQKIALQSAQARLAAIEQNPQWPTISEAIVNAETSCIDTRRKFDDAKGIADGFDAEAIARQITSLERRLKAADDAISELNEKIIRLEATIESEGGLGLAEKNALAQDELEAAEAAFQRVLEEAQTLKLLRETLELARTETSERFVGPVALRAKRHIERLLPGCEIKFDENMILQSVRRAGFDEDCDLLSKGTQEQLAILTRIAFADMLREQGAPVSLILDDPLVYSDDGRLDLMLDILTEAAERMQVIILTCRDRAFRHMNENRLLITASNG